MHVKKTKTGKLSIELECNARAFIFDAIMDFLDENAKSSTLKSETEVMRHLHYSVLNEMVIRKNNFSPNLAATIKVLLRRSEAVALMWLLRRHDESMPILQLKSELHKQLCS
jgi:hypothetical protein